MRNYRALLLAIAALVVLVIVLLFALLNRHSTITTVVSSGGLIGGSAKVGDTLTFRTYQAGDPGYTVEFTGLSPCASHAKDLKVTSDQPASCPIVSSGGTQVSYIYLIKRNISQNVVRPETVVPCKLCYLNVGSVAGDSTEQPMHAANPPSDNANVQIGCTVGDNGAPGVSPNAADVTNDGVATVGWLQIDSAWAVTFKGLNPCTAKNFSSDGSNGPSQCSIDPNAPPNSPNAPPMSYTYGWTLTCNGKPAYGTGTVMVYAPQSGQ